ncbi:MAG TPA: SulP family inorganic anion transporter [Pseudonocardia sp.]|nr:SulP family inorganic anion transporter [Pseudonocardia sp.]
MAGRWPAGVPLLRGVLPVHRARVLPDVLAGITLAALAIPEVLGYARIAGMPVVTGLYTMLVPLVVFALLGASRHLVVGADSATAAILAAGLLTLAAPGSPRYVQLAGTAALLVAILLLLARVLRLGFLANFLSRTVLVGFLTGVGIQVAVGQLGQLLGVTEGGGSTVRQLWEVLRGLPTLHANTVAVSVAVLAVVLGCRLVARRIPGALLAVVGAIVASHLLALPAHGVAVLGSVPAGLPGVHVPGLTSADLGALLPTVISMAVVVLAQSAATSRAYALRYNEPMDLDADLVGMAGANLAASLTGAFVVNGSPTKTQMVDSAGGRTQLSQLSAAVVVLLVLVVLTGPLAALPLAALASVVFLIGAELVDLAGMRRIYQVRRTEFGVALLTAAAVVFLGVEQGILLAIAASVVDHLRHSYHPRSSVLAKSPAGHWRLLPVAAGARSTAGFVIYRFGTSLYFANASQLAQDVRLLVGSGAPVTWFCLDGAAIGDVDYSAALVLDAVFDELRTGGIRVVCSNIIDPVRADLGRYGLTAKLDADSYFDTSGAVLAAYQSSAARGH